MVELEYKLVRGALTFVSRAVISCSEEHENLSGV